MDNRENTLVTIAFCGTRYHGFQVQKNALTVCEKIQDAIQAVFGERYEVKGCSRTDAGVHARAYCLNFWAPTGLSCEKLPLALNHHLPEDIRALRARRVPADFHARYSAVSKEYRYVLRNSSVEDAFAPHLSYRIAGIIDQEKMDQGGKLLVGTHDFSAFMSAGSDIQDTVRTVHRLSVWREEEYVHLAIEADGYLYNMVRIISGTLLQVGQGKLSLSGLQEILEKRQRKYAGDTLAAKGLFLHAVTYDWENG